MASSMWNTQKLLSTSLKKLNKKKKHWVRSLRSNIWDNKPLTHYLHFILKCVSDTSRPHGWNLPHKKVTEFTQSTDKQANDPYWKKSHFWGKVRALYNRDWQLTRHSPDSADYSHSLIQCNASTSCCRVKSKQARRQGGTMLEKLHFSLLHCMWNAVVYTGRSADPLSRIKWSLSPKRKTRGNGIVLCVIPHWNVEQGRISFVQGWSSTSSDSERGAERPPGGSPPNPGRCRFWPEEALKCLRMFWLFFRHTRNNINANTECLNWKELNSEAFP